jgi:ABC-2 type transport system permease protein/sodium transport system permease protein
MSLDLPRADQLPGLSVSRVARLALKELRETLRDRRTIITLVLMPLLVYPVLSLAFHQFLLSSFQNSKGLELNIGFDSETSQADFQQFMMLLTQGDKLLKERESAAATAPSGGGPVLGADLGASEPSVSSINPVRVEDLEAEVREQRLDMGVRLMPAGPNTPALGQSRYQLVYRPNTPISRQAADFIVRRLRIMNEQDLLNRLEKQGDDQPVRAFWRLKPIADEEGQSFWLGTLVPLVLILMTITGAVYPAIDLTAGERERGTLEALMAAPVPRLGLLLGKYIAVLTVAMLTAVVNLTAMTVTIVRSGLGSTLFGVGGLTPSAIVAVLLLLVLFAAFFSAVLLTITSFARSFKEAQAYVIPLMVVSLAPGFITVMPGLELGPLFSVMPLANIVLLARDVLKEDASLLWGAVAVLSTVLYGAAALALAARIFGSDAILYGSEGSWSDLFRRTREKRTQPTIAGALLALATVVPLYVISTGVLAQLARVSIAAQLLAAAGFAFLLFLLVPVAFARGQGVLLREGFQLRGAPAGVWLAAAVLGATLWPLAVDSILLCQQLGLATIDLERLAEQRPELLQMVERLRLAPLPVVLLALAIAPAIGEEFFFRGYLLGALRGRLPGWMAIGLVGAVFGLFHASVGGVIAVERIVSSTFLGLVLGWVCWTTRSVLPGMALHFMNNALMVSLAYFEEQLKGLGWDRAGMQYLPLPLVAGTSVAAVAAGFALWWQTRQKANANASVQASAAIEQPADTPAATNF